MKEAEELQKERRELTQKLKTQEKRVDYLERAKRLEEIPLLEKAFAEKQEQDRAFWEQHEAERIQTLVEERELAVKCAERLNRMKEDKDTFLDKLKAERKNLYLVRSLTLPYYRSLRTLEFRSRLQTRIPLSEVCQNWTQCS